MALKDTELTIDDIRWFQRFYELEQFKKRFEHTRVPSNWGENIALANWVHSARKRRKSMEGWKETMLNDIGFEWVIRPHIKRPISLLEKDPEAIRKVTQAIEKKIIITSEDPRTFTSSDYQWYFTLLELIQFKDKYGHTSVPGLCKDNPSLGHWVMRLRRDKAKLPDSRIAALDVLGFVWRIYEVVRTPWEDRFTGLIAYKKQHGHVNVPQSFPVLGRWVWMQRRDRKSIPEKRKALLDKIGFVWDFNDRNKLRMRYWQKTENQWKKHFEDLQAFKLRFGHCNVQPYWKEDINFARWVARQRSLYHANQLPENRFTALHEIGFVWDIYKVARLTRFFGRKARSK